MKRLNAEKLADEETKIWFGTSRWSWSNLNPEKFEDNANACCQLTFIAHPLRYSQENPKRSGSSSSERRIGALDDLNPQKLRIILLMIPVAIWLVCKVVARSVFWRRKPLYCLDRFLLKPLLTGARGWSLLLEAAHAGLLEMENENRWLWMLWHGVWLEQWLAYIYTKVKAHLLMCFEFGVVSPAGCAEYGGASFCGARSSPVATDPEMSLNQTGGADPATWHVVFEAMLTLVKEDDKSFSKMWLTDDSDSLPRNLFRIHGQRAELRLCSAYNELRSAVLCANRQQSVVNGGFGCTFRGRSSQWLAHQPGQAGTVLLSRRMKWAGSVHRVRSTEWASPDASCMEKLRLGLV